LGFCGSGSSRRTAADFRNVTVLGISQQHPFERNQVLSFSTIENDRLTRNEATIVDDKKIRAPRRLDSIDPAFEWRH
jgi:hypothetical protein